MNATQIGTRLREIRKSLGMSLATLAADAAVSEATLSRIETGRSEAAAALLYRLAALLGVEITTFFANTPTPLHSGIRSVMRKGDGGEFDSTRLSARVLCADLSDKKMHPFLNHVSAKTLAQAGGLSSHEGEEYLYIVRGSLVLHSQAYAPLRLDAGDSVYFDAAQPHAYVNAGQHAAEFLVVASTGLPDMEPELKEDPLK